MRRVEAPAARITVTAGRGEKKQGPPLGHRLVAVPRGGPWWSGRRTGSNPPFCRLASSLYFFTRRRPLLLLTSANLP